MLYRIYSLIILIFLLVGCNKRETTTLRIQPVFGLNNQPVTLCNDDNPHGIAIEQLQFFLSEFKLNGKQLQLVEELSGVQNQDVVLVGGDCSSATWQVQLPKLNRNDVLEFSMSVPFEINHLNPLTQTSPLNLPEMFWTWQQGHKFLRLDSKIAGNSWAFHLGSIGCASPSVMRAPANECAIANRYDYKVTLGDEPTMLFDVSLLLESVDFSIQQECMGDPKQLACKAVMENLPKTLFRSEL